MEEGDGVTSFGVRDVERVLVAHASRPARRHLVRALSVAWAEVSAVDAAADAIDALTAREADLFVVDGAMCVGPDGEALLRAVEGAPGCRMLALVPREGVSCLADVLDGRPVPHLLAHGGALVPDALPATAVKLLRRDLFGVDKYLGWGVTPREFWLSTTADRYEVVAAIGEDLRRAGFGKWVESRMLLVADELVSNAIYHAPVCGDGQREHSDARRDEFRYLSRREQVRVRTAFDGRYAGLEVTDQFGSLERRSLFGHLTDVLRERKVRNVKLAGGGAGVGLAITYSSCDHLVFNIARGRRTEAIALFDTAARASERRGAVPSLSVFEQPCAA